MIREQTAPTQADGVLSVAGRQQKRVLQVLALCAPQTGGGPLMITTRSFPEVIASLTKCAAGPDPQTTPEPDLPVPPQTRVLLVLNNIDSDIGSSALSLQQL